MQPLPNWENILPLQIQERLVLRAEKLTIQEEMQVTPNNKVILHGKGYSQCKMPCIKLPQMGHTSDKLLAGS